MVEKIELSSFGELLKEYRTKKKFSIATIATQMHLDPQVIRALEDNDYTALPDPIYVRGYIRSYCKILGQDADECLELFRVNFTGDDPKIIPEIRHPVQTSSSDKLIKLLTFLISLGLIVLLIVWWQSNFIVKNTADNSPSISEDPMLSNPEVTEPLNEEVVSNEVKNLSEESADNSNNNDLSIIPTSANENILINPDESNEDTSLININETVPEESTIPDPMLEEPLTTDPVADDSEKLQIDNTTNGSDQLVLSEIVGLDILALNVTANSWIEIFDINKQKLFYDLGRAGDKLTLHGTAPFDITLGFAPGVTIEFNGKTVELAPYTRSSVAIFTLGE